jgi:hypothetical protein
MTDDPVIRVERGCPAPAGVGCGCFGACHELIDVMPAADYWQVVGERDEARRQLYLMLEVQARAGA